ncbi:MAG: HAMP domain-containing histidine kinase [Lachnospiraceae bacterium]|nr:HAMP domain-containing histidine kinase [Lachnospiraceae bacterium]
MNQAEQQAKERKKKMRSTAGKIHRLFLGKLVLIFLLMDMVLGAIGFSGLLYIAETESLGSFSMKDTDVDFDWYGDEFTILFTRGDETGMFTPSRDALLVMRGLGYGLLGTEGFLLLWAFLFYRFPIRRKLRPLREMAESAQMLTGLDWEQEKMANLTYAISHIDAGSGAPRLETHDSELRGIENAMNDLLDRMRESYREQTRFVSDASHELRTPIAVIKGYADMLDRWGKEDEQVLTEGITAIKAESDRMNTLVEQLLFLARGDSGRQHLTMEEISLSNIMQEVYDESVMIDSKHKYELQREPGDIVCIGDYGMLKQAVRIFVDNAAKYTTEGDTISLRVGINRARLCPYVSVQDNGIGMSSEDVKHIFERFYRSDVARNSKTGGTGLGLSIAKWIIDRHRGTIEVITREEIGTRFTVFLQPATTEAAKA